MPRKPEEQVSRRPPYFWWLLVNLLALCFAVLSWVVCLEVFGNPEVPRNYELLKKLGRLPEVESFKPSDVPEGRHLGPEEVYRKFFGLTEKQCSRLEKRWKRDYLASFEQPLGVIYIHGAYQVEVRRAFGEDDYLIDGFAVRARALVKPDDFTKPSPYPVMMEFLFPTHDERALEGFPDGHVFEIPRIGRHAWVVMHVSKIWMGDEQGVLVTAIPITKGSCSYASDGEFEIETPEEVRPRVAFPVFDVDAIKY